MKRNTYIFVLVCCVAVTSMGFFSCKGYEWDTEESLIGMSHSWAYSYVGKVINRYNDYYTAVFNSADNKRVSVTINDTLAVESVFTGMFDGDSVNITTTVVMVDSVMTVVSDGYRFADNITAHIFTVDPGIVGCNGKLHIDFYQTEGMIPWAWTEVTFKSDDGIRNFYPDSFEDTEFGWY